MVNFFDFESSSLLRLHHRIQSLSLFLCWTELKLLAYVQLAVATSFGFKELLKAFKISHDQYKRADIKESIIQDLVEAYKKGLGAQETEDKSKLPVNS